MSDTQQSPAVGRHPWYNNQGEADPRIAGIWLANLLLAAGAEPWRAFMAAAELSREIAWEPSKFRKIP